MKKLICITCIAMLSLAGCSSTELESKIDHLENKVDTLAVTTALQKRAIASLKIAAAYEASVPSGPDYETARIKTRIQVLDDTFSRDLEDFRKKLRESEQLIEFQAARIESLEADRRKYLPLLESLKKDQ